MAPKAVRLVRPLAIQGHRRPGRLFQLFAPDLDIRPGGVAIRGSAGWLYRRRAEAGEGVADVGGALDAFGEGGGGGARGLDRPVHAAVVLVEPEQGADLLVFGRDL